MKMIDGKEIEEGDVVVLSEAGIRPYNRRYSNREGVVIMAREKTVGVRWGTNKSYTHYHRSHVKLKQ